MSPLNSPRAQKTRWERDHAMLSAARQQSKSLAPGCHSNVQTQALNCCRVLTPFPGCAEVCGYLHLTVVSCMVCGQAAPACCLPQCFSLGEVQTVSTSCSCKVAGHPLTKVLQVKQHVLFNQTNSFSQLEGKHIVTKKKKLRKQGENKNKLPKYFLKAP